jgi:hypothetical protein
LKYSAAEKNAYIEEKQLQKNVFSFPLQVKISGKAEKLLIDRPSTSFKIKADQKPASLMVDFETEFLMSSTGKEIN